MAKNGDGTASLNEVFTALRDGFNALWDSVWNYPIPWENVFGLIGWVFIFCVGAIAAVFVFAIVCRLAVGTGKFLWGLLTIAWLLTKRRLKL